MTYKTILVHIDSGSRCPARLDIGIRLAARFDAHLVGLHALSMLHIPGYAVAEAGAGIIDTHRRLALADAQRAEAAFRRAVDRAGLPNAEWRASLEDASKVVALHARYADLAIIGQPDPAGNDSGVDPALAYRLVLAVGRPVLVIPYVGQFDAVGKRVLLAWNGTREATRAVVDALPFLGTADVVNVVAVNPDGRSHGDEAGADIGLYLARHGVKVKVAPVKGTDIDAGNELLSRAADLSADLIVMGAYGHSRLSELVLGGATRTIFESMTVPVLMAH